MLLYCSLAFLLVSLVAPSLGDGDTRLVGGQIIKISNAPYALQLRRENVNFCGATLVTRILAITAAHCLEKGVNNIQVVGGANTILEKGIQRSVVKHLIPADYSKATLQMDVAILKVDRPFTEKTVGTLPICSKPWAPGKSIQVLGWGIVREKGSRSKDLRTIDISMIEHAECLSKNDLSPVQNDSRECAFESNKDACKGDSGGPAVFGGELCGVISAGAGCADERYPGLYTSVYKIRAYIIKAMETM